MDASSMWSYPGVWVGLGIMVVLLGGIALFAYALRRTLRAPPVEEAPPAAPASPPAPSAQATPTDPEKSRHP